jgi:hypothetical protein
MTSDPTDWHEALARVSGQLVRGEERAATHELLTVHLGVPVTDRACRRLKRIMRDLGWHGPRLMRWGKKTLKGYWRHPTVGLPAIVRDGAVAEVATAERETLAPELEAVTRLGLKKIAQILALPTDPRDGNILRAQTAAAGLAVNAQLRADETRLKQAQRGDVLAKIIAVVEEERKLIEDQRRKRGEGEGPAGAHTDIVGHSGINITPTQDANDRT